MKKQFGWLLALAVPAVIVSCQKEVITNEQPQEEIFTAAGNGTASGPHYDLNIIGVPEDKNPDFSGGNDHRIFVDLTGKTRILLTKGDFDVLDANGTDGEASFQLPEPDAQDDNITDYSVFIRGLGKTGGRATMQTCYLDQQTQEEVCNTGNAIANVTAQGDDNKFQNVTKQLMYVWADINGDGTLDRVELFSDPLDTYYWYYDNFGLKIAQLRFYPGVGTDVSTGVQ